jgi:hypothetical protein
MKLVFITEQNPFHHSLNDCRKSLLPDLPYEPPPGVSTPMMKRMFIFVPAVVAILFLAGCDFHRERLVGPYLVLAIDTPEQMSVAYDLGDGDSIGRIEPVVFSVGWSDRYIVAKQHPAGNRGITYFYYLDISKDSKYADPTNSVVGPLTETEFRQKQREVGLPSFTRTIKSLE